MKEFLKNNNGMQYATSIYNFADETITFVTSGGVRVDVPVVILSQTLDAYRAEHATRNAWTVFKRQLDEILAGDKYQVVYCGDLYEQVVKLSYDAQKDMYRCNCMCGITKENFSPLNDRFGPYDRSFKIVPNVKSFKFENV